MKAKYAWVALLTLTFFGCDDNTGALGLGMFPEGDQLLNGKTITYEVLTQSKIAEKVFSKTTVGYVGKFTDPNFGYYEAGFLAQLHCPDSLSFPSVYDEVTNPHGIMVKDEVYTTELVLSYTSYFGDSLNACRMSVYQLGGGAKELDKESAYYTNIDPTEYYNANDPSALLGRKAYTAVNLSLSDSIRSSSNFYPYVRLTLPKDKGAQILAASRQADHDKKNFADIFKEIFKGIYVKSDYGDGTVLYIDQIELNVVYEVYVKDSLNMKPLKKKYEKDEAGNLKDSTAYSKRTFAATREIIQANSFKNDQTKLAEKVAETNWTYLKTPAGIYTQGTLPLEKIAKELSGDTLNAVKLTFTSYNQSDDLNKYKYSMSAPSSVLLVREKNLDAFFANNKLADGISSFIANRNTSTNQYVFNNLVQLVTTCLSEKEAAKKAAGSSWNEEKWMEENPLWDKVALIPVLVGYDTSSTPSIISIRNDLRPSYVKLKGGNTSLDLPANKRGEALSFEITYTSFGSNK